jgi:hypothetical protein
MSRSKKKESFVKTFAKDLAAEKLTGYTESVNKTVKEMLDVSEDLMRTNSNEERKRIIAEKTMQVTDKLSSTFQMLKKEESKETVDHPQHYGGDTIYEVIKVLEAWSLDFHLGNVVKYVSRAGKKNKTKELEDLEKALWYLQRRIKILKETRGEK